jgi:hypothetical protein
MFDMKIDVLYPERENVEATSPIKAEAKSTSYYNMLCGDNRTISRQSFFAG